MVRPGGQAGKTLCILAVDRQPLFLAGLRRLLAEAPLKGRVEQAERSDQALEMVENLPVDLVLCDARAEPLTGAELAGALSERKPRLPVILLGEPDDGALVPPALKEGAAGFLSKHISLPALIAALQAVLSGHLVISRSFGLTDLGQASTGPNAPDDNRQRLTRAEREVLGMIGRAWSVEEIASARGSRQKTVRNQVASIYRKLELRNRTEAVIRAVQLGLVDRAGIESSAGQYRHVPAAAARPQP